MNTKDYTDEIKRTAPFLGSDFLNQLHMSIGLSTEPGEILDTFKKSFAYGKELDIVNIKEELGDCFWYIFNLMRMLGLDFEDVLQLNVEKLRARYKDGYSKEEALNRDLNKERSILDGTSSVSFPTNKELAEEFPDLIAYTGGAGYSYKEVVGDSIMNPIDAETVISLDEYREKIYNGEA